MKLGIMQPYLFPYIGYFQLVNAVDKFIFYDDVMFIKNGWINRNRILANNEIVFFTVPIENISSFTKINQTKICNRNYNKWLKKFLRTLKQNYSHAEFFGPIYNIVIEVLESPPIYISELASRSILVVIDYLGINSEIKYASKEYINNGLKGEERIIDICKNEKADEYINLPGGIDLYNGNIFKANEIVLSFIKSNPVYYKQLIETHITSLSIIDVMMFNSIEVIRKMIESYELAAN